MQTIRIEKCVNGAWRDAWDLVERRPFFISMSFAALLLTGVAQHELRSLDGAHTWLAIGALWLFAVLLLSYIAVQTLRDVLPEKAAVVMLAPRSRDFLRYCALTYGLLLCAMVTTLIVLALVSIVLPMFGVYSHRRAFSAMELCAVVMASVWVQVRLSLLPSQLAIGRPLRWRAAWRDTRGHFWSILGTHFAIALTLTGAALVAGVIAGVLVLVFGESSHGPIVQFTQILLLIPAMVLYAAGSGWIYRRYASELLESSQDA